RQADALRDLAASLLAARRTEEACQAASSAAAIFQELGDVSGQAAAARIACDAQLAGGDCQQAARWAEQSASLFRRAANWQQEAESLLVASAAHAARAVRRHCDAS
ncbi:unnamed protein product, partial [Polarella glacialis]